MRVYQHSLDATIRKCIAEGPSIKKIVVKNKHKMRLAALQNTIIKSAILDNGDFYNAQFYNANLFKTSFNFADLRYANFQHARANMTSFIESKIENVDFHFAMLRAAYFENINLHSSCFYNTDLSKASLIKCDLRGAKFQECNLTDVDMTDSLLDMTTVFQDCIFRTSQYRKILQMLLEREIELKNRMLLETGTYIPARESDLLPTVRNTL